MSTFRNFHWSLLYALRRTGYLSTLLRAPILLGVTSAVCLLLLAGSFAQSVYFARGSFPLFPPVSTLIGSAAQYTQAVCPCFITSSFGRQQYTPDSSSCDTLPTDEISPLPLWPACAFVKGALELGFEVHHFYCPRCALSQTNCHPTAVLVSKKICQVRALQLLVFNNVAKE